jgi:hypothetical protein
MRERDREREREVGGRVLSVQVLLHLEEQKRHNLTGPDTELKANNCHIWTTLDASGPAT